MVTGLVLLYGTTGLGGWNDRRLAGRAETRLWRIYRAPGERLQGPE